MTTQTNRQRPARNSLGALIAVTERRLLIDFQESREHLLEVGDNVSYKFMHV